MSSKSVKRQVNNDNVWKANGLPEMEYCSLRRAAELLKCKVHDLLHFAEIRAIELCIKTQGFESALYSPMHYREKSEWENFCGGSLSVLLGLNPPIRGGGVSRFSPKFTHSIDFLNGKTTDSYFYEYADSPALRRPLVFLFGLWVIAGLTEWSIFSELPIKGEISLSALDFTLKEADYEFNPEKDDVFFVSPLTEHLYENNGLLKKRVTPIVTLTIDDLYITKIQINKIYSNIGGEVPILRNEEKNQSHVIKEHHTQIKAYENRLKIHKAITKLFALYPHNPNDDATNYRTTEGKIIIARIAKCLDYHAATLFDDRESPIKDDLTLRNIISDYLKDIGCKNE
ncbi:hypothetical protein XBO1_2520017 [Xenorhabdus bovienii str. oregonense]|uniref:Uncharacterized protein n=1 Tax=Xenorhabdus bovienii str. oregonense TaxID=1398202 RepID=A0A077PBH5_XENBV|nr:hypothetical protein [Xenorhabdus bovienii]CDH07046.1 hypothetical protein XBO1_2520017 [Xenorhabdus bovienii str. oregonense]